MKQPLSAMLSGLLLSACLSNSSSGDITEVKEGMTKEQVVAIMGEPEMKTVLGSVGTDEQTGANLLLEHWIYGEDHNAGVGFTNGRVSSIEPDQGKIREWIEGIRKP